jgi:hypothetical protein
MLKNKNMKAKFYYVPDLELVINLEQLSSFQRARPINNDSVSYKCCLVVGKSIFWCDLKNYYSLKVLVL